MRLGAVVEHECYCALRLWVSLIFRSAFTIDRSTTIEFVRLSRPRVFRVTAFSMGRA